MAEVIKIDQITSFLAQVETTLGAIKSLLDFSPNHKSCFHQSNSFIDDMAQVAPMIMSQQFGASVSGQWQFDFCKLNVYIFKITFSIFWKNELQM